MTWIAAHQTLLITLVCLVGAPVVATVTSYLQKKPVTLGVSILLDLASLAQRWLTAYAPVGTVGIGGTRASIPFLHAPKVSNGVGGPGAGVGPGAAATLLLMGSLVFAGCVSAYCKQPENSNTARCKAERVIVDCGAPEVLKIVKEIGAKVFAALMSQNFDALLGDIMSQLKTDGVADPLGVVTCAINDAMTKVTATPNDERTVVSTHVQLYKKVHPCEVKARVVQ